MRLASCERAQRMERVVGYKPTPCEGPERIDGFAWIPATHRFMERTKERCTPGAQAIENRGFSSAIRAYPSAWPELIGGQQQREMVREEQGDTAVVVAERFNPDPDDFSRCCEAVEICRIVPVDSGRQN